MTSATTPQLLPLHIEHDGPVPVDTYFSVGRDEEGNKTAAFRGRTMFGVDLALPDGYAGVVLQTGEESVATPVKKREPSRNRRAVMDVDEEYEEDHENDAPKTRLEAASTFTEIGLWRADIPVDLKSDEYARGLDEWTRMAALVHAPDDDEPASVEK